MGVKDISDEECRLSLSFYNHYILQFTEFSYNSVILPSSLLNSDRNSPAITLHTPLKPSIGYIMVKGV